MILIFVMKEFDKELAVVSRLVQKMEINSYYLEQDSIKLLLSLEEKAEKYSLPIQPRLALIRGNLICGYKEEKTSIMNRKEKNREKKRFITKQLMEAVQCVEEYFTNARKQFDECEQICGQIVMHAYNKGLHQISQDLYTLASQDPELAAPLANVKSVIGTANARFIFDQAQAYIQ